MSPKKPHRIRLVCKPNPMDSTTRKYWFIEAKKFFFSNWIPYPQCYLTEYAANKVMPNLYFVGSDLKSVKTIVNG